MQPRICFSLPRHGLELLRGFSFLSSTLILLLRYSSLREPREAILRSVRRCSRSGCSVLNLLLSQFFSSCSMVAPICYFDVPIACEMLNVEAGPFSESPDQKTRYFMV
jgi:hypothetical protein